MRPTEELERNPLWPLLIEAVHSLPMYRAHKAYVRDSILIDSPDISAEVLSHRLGVTLGEAMVILREIANEKRRERNDEQSEGPGDPAT
jgi:hypothetical protein